MIVSTFHEVLWCFVIVLFCFAIYLSPQQSNRWWEIHVEVAHQLQKSSLRGVQQAH